MKPPRRTSCDPKPIIFKHPSGAFSYTVGVNAVQGTHHLHSLVDFISWMHKRLKKETRFKKVQRWVHRVYLRRATVYVYAEDSDEDPRVFPQALYCDVTEPEITLILDIGKGLLMTLEERTGDVPSDRR